MRVADFGVFALLPPLLAIVFAMVSRKVFQSLLLGMYVAGIMVAGADYLNAGGIDPSFVEAGATSGVAEGALFWLPFAAMAGGFIQMVTWLVEGMAGIDTSGSFYIGHPAVIAFTVFLGALVALMQRSGGVRGFGEYFMALGTGRRGGMMFASVGGMFLAIDDYFHVIAAGSIFRPVTDKLKISREKLSYLIDSTAAPMVILIPISTWAGYIVGEISGTQHRGDLTTTGGAFGIFLDGIPFNFYAILTIAFVVFIAASGRDWGPMAKAERRAMRGDGVEREGAKPLMSKELDLIEPILAPRTRNLVVPVLFLIFSTLITLAVMGGFPATNFGEAMSGTPLPELGLAISSFLSLLFAMTFYSFQGMKQDDFTDRALDGAKAMIPALAILALAWGIGNAVSAVGLGDWMAGTICADVSDPTTCTISAQTVPLIAFIMAGIIAFATGTSFGTFAIMIPVALPVAFVTGGEAWLGPALAASIGGAVFGDHCSPISDTTVMSSMAAQADHIDHVRTQLPYALAVAAMAIGGYTILAITGSSVAAWITNALLFAAVVAMTFILWRRGARA